MIAITVEKKDPRKMAEDFLAQVGDLDLRSVDETALAHIQKLTKMIKDELAGGASPAILSQLVMKGKALLPASEGEGEQPESGGEGESPEAPEAPEGGMANCNMPQHMDAMQAIQEIKQMLLDMKRGK